ncbi:UNVERIFIED_CONTAM: hypothetical protein Sradi_0837500 [Sesamum radiatum]|uniref:Calmodulin-binding domain-containing protein n=1 Tax=Sesamum radiatum TaxID=300843 RepID=A0AAW2V179_SESRA
MPRIRTEKSALESIPEDHATALPSPSSPKSLPPAKLPSLEEHDVIKHNGNEADGSGSNNIVSVEIGNVQPVKGNQIRLEVIQESTGRDLHSSNNSPRILRFRRPRVAWPEDGKVDLKRRIFKRNGGKDDAAGAELCSGKIILKHQDVQGKTDGKILLNNVLEETASKLVESRKGKVKALVGAFETVISLHERKRTLRIVG